MTSLSLKDDNDTVLPSWSGSVKSGAFFPSSILPIGSPRIQGVWPMPSGYRFGRFAAILPDLKRIGRTERPLMKNALSILALLLASCASRPEPTAVGWTSLFNGRDLEGWVSNGSAVWRVVDGATSGGQEGDPKRAGTLATQAMYQDFELALDFLIDEHGKYNSGIYIRN